MHTRRGFTVVEVAIVITVIAILATIGTFSFSALQRQQRDADRRATAQIIMNSLEKYYDSNGNYPYALDLNPTANRTALPNYNAVRQAMPDLTDGILNRARYTFMPLACPVSNRNCTSTATQQIGHRTQYLYMSNVQGVVPPQSVQFELPEWGCRITPTTDAAPSAALAWREESTGKWVFIRSKQGQISIVPTGSGPASPTECAFTNL